MAYKSPFYIRNLFLMTVLGMILFVIYCIYFRADGNSYTNIMNILRGLNSNTFNYLESQRYFLGLGDEVVNLDTYVFGKDPLPSEEEYAVKLDSVADLPTTEFYSQCVRLNKPCVLRGLADKWPALEKWGAENGGKDYLKELLGDHKIAAFTEVSKDKKNPLISSRSHSFQQSYRKQMTYSNFVDLQAKKPM